MKSAMIIRRAVLLFAFAAFASNALTAYADELKRRGMIGIMPGGPPRQDDGTPGMGMVVMGLIQGGPAEAAGLESNDVIVKINGVELSAPQSFGREMRKYFGGDKLSLTILRDDKEITKELTLQPRPKETGDGYEVIYDTLQLGDKKLRSYVTKPKGAGKHAAVVFVTSPLPQPMEFPAPQLSNHPYKKLIDALTEAGIVTMRVDRVGVGDSEGDDPMATPLKTDVAMYKNAIQRLASYEFVDPKAVFVFSHGMGSALAPLAAEGAGVRGVAIFGSTVLRPWRESMTEQFERMWKLEAVKDNVLAQRMKLLEDFFKAIQEPGAKPSAFFKEEPAYADFAQAIGQQGDEFLFGIKREYFDDVAAVDYPKAWSKVDAPVLSMWGEADFQANRKDAELLVELVNKSHSGNAEFAALKGVDHNVSTMADMEDSYLSGQEGAEFNPIVAETLVKWIKKTSDRKA